jgi:hypothetical protein
MLGNEAMTYFLPKQILAKEGGMHPDAAAEAAGFHSGDAMLKALIKAEQDKRRLDIETGKNKSIRQHMIDQEVTKRLDDKYGDFLNTADIEKEALSAVHNRAQEAALATEMRVLGRKDALPGISLESARDFAARTIAARKVGEVAPSRYARAEEQAARKAEIALLKGKPSEAYQYKRQQILNHLLFTAAEEANKEIEKGQKLFDRLGKATIKGLDQEFTDRIHELLNRFGVSVDRGDELTRGLKGESLEGFVSRKYGDGYELAIDPTLYDPAVKGSIDQLTVDQFRTLTDAVKSLQTVGRDVNSIVVNGERVELETVKAKIIDELKAMKQRPKSQYYRPEDEGRIAGIREKIGSFFRTVDASLLTKDTQFDKADMNDAFGPLNTYVLRPLRESMDRENDMRTKVSGQVREVFKSQPKEWRKSLNDDIPTDESITDPKSGQPFKFTRKRMLSMALNVGAQDNLTKLADGYQWQEPAVMDYLNRNMTKADWDFVSGMWKVVGQFREGLDALNRRVKGTGIEFVETKPVETKFGTIEGGYFPLVYDPLRSSVSERHMESATDSMFDKQYYRITTPSGSTISRVTGVKRPVLLDLDIIPWKIGQAIHDLSFRESVMDAHKILSDPDIRSAYDDAWGHEYTKTLLPWLRFIANSRNVNDAAMSWIDTVANWARTSATALGIGFRLSTMEKHGAQAAINSVAELGPEWTARGVKEFLGTPSQMGHTWDMVLELSPMMRNRSEHYDRDIGDRFNSMLNDSSIKGAMGDIRRYGFMGVAYLDMYSAMPTWLGAFRKSKAEGMSEADAVYFADRMVIKAHGLGSPVDQAAIMQGGEVTKLMTMFYSFMNRMYNKQSETAGLVKEAGAKVIQGDFAGARRDFPKVLAKTMAYFVTLGI